MKIKIYQVDAFADSVFTGNPAAVCPLEDKWLDDSTMQNIASENNLSETAFYIFSKGKYSIRWFTPLKEVDLCGHATLASGYVQFFHENYTGNIIEFGSKSGILGIRKDKEYLTMDFPSDEISKVEKPDSISDGFSIKPAEIYKGKSDYLLIYNKEEDILNIKVDLEILKKTDCRGFIISARGKSSDFVSRFFAPAFGVNEDPVTGSAHTTLTPYWSRILNKNELTAIQLSARKGFLICKNLGTRIEISGKAQLYMQGEINI